MKVTAYAKYFNATPQSLDAEERNQVFTYFQLLGKVESPMVSLVVPVFRAKETLMAHIFSLIHLKTIVPYEVIFVDNNADEASLSILQEMGAHIVKEERQGITYARQKGLERARGEVVCSLDPDTIYEPWYIDKMAIPCLLYTSPSPRDLSTSRMPSSA